MYCLIILAFISPAFAFPPSINNAIGEFSIALLKATNADGLNNIYSPYSIMTALGMFLVGAKNETFDNMAEVMFLRGKTMEFLEDAFERTIVQLGESLDKDGFNVSVGHRMYVNESHEVKDEFYPKLYEIFEADGRYVDFQNSNWMVKYDAKGFVKNATHNLISNFLMRPPPLNSSIVLVNAFEFRGLWKQRFAAMNSFDRFNKHYDGSGMSTYWLGVEKTFKYGHSDELEATLIELPYRSQPTQDQKTSMVLIFPDAKHKFGFTSWIKSKFQWSTISRTVRSNKKTKVRLVLPEFKIEKAIELSDVLKDMGMTAPFAEGANFRTMFDPAFAEPILSSLHHTATVTINEKGTESPRLAVVDSLDKDELKKDKKAVELTIDRSFVAMIILYERNATEMVPLLVCSIDRTPMLLN